MPVSSALFGSLDDCPNTDSGIISARMNSLLILLPFGIIGRGSVTRIKATQLMASFYKLNDMWQVFTNCNLMHNTSWAGFSADGFVIMTQKFRNTHWQF